MLRMYKNKKVSLILPAYNEEESILSVINGFSRVGVIDEIIVIDNNSKDQTSKLAKATKKAKVITEKKQGYGHALQKGMRVAKGDLLVLCDTDNTYTPKDIFKLLKYSQKFDCVFSTRTNKAFHVKGGNMRGARRWANIAVGRLIQLLFSGPTITDPGATFRLINKNVFNKLKNKFTVGGVHFQPELTIQLLLNGFTIKEVPVRYGARTGKSKISGPLWGGIKTARKMLTVILYYRLRTLMGKLAK